MNRPEQPDRPQRQRPQPRGRYAAIADKRHGKSSNVAFMIGGLFAVVVVLVVVVTATRMSGNAERERQAAEAKEVANSEADRLAQATAATNAARIAAAQKKAQANHPDTADPGATDPQTPAAPVRAAVPAPDISPVLVKYAPMPVGPWVTNLEQIEFVDSYECPRATINTALGKPMTLTASAPERKLMVVYLAVDPKEDYSANERAALSKLPIVAEGARKLASDEWLLVSDHFALATIDPATGARVAAKPLLLFAEDEDSGFSIAGSDDKSRLDFAMFITDPTSIVAVFEVNAGDKMPLLILRPVPGLLPTPALRITVTDSGTKGSAGHAPLVNFDPALAPGETRAKPVEE